MALDNYRSNVRAFTFISAGATLLAVIGYLLMKSDRKKAKRKASFSSNKENDESIKSDNSSQISKPVDQNIDHLEVKLQKIEIEEIKAEITPSYEDSIEEKNSLTVTPLIPELPRESPTEPVEAFIGEEEAIDEKSIASSTSSSNKLDEPDQSNLDVKDPTETNYNSDTELQKEIKLIFANKPSVEVTDYIQTKQSSYTSSPIYSNSSKEDYEYIAEKKTSECLNGFENNEHLTDQECQKDIAQDEMVPPNEQTQENEYKEAGANQEALVSSIELNLNHLDERQEETTTVVSSIGSSQISIEKEIIASGNKNSSMQITNSTINNNNKKTSKSPKKRTPSTASNSSSLSYTLSPSKNNGSSKKHNSKRSKTSTKTIETPRDQAVKSKEVSLVSIDKEPESPADVEDLVVYEFNFPRKLCGKLIGRNGVHVDFIRSKTNTQIAVRNDTKFDELQVVCVSGRISDVDKALDIIGNRFPSKLYPQISFKPISKPIVYRRFNKETTSTSDEIEQSKILVAETNFVEFADQQNNDLIPVQVTAIVNAGHVFVQLPTHPTYNDLQQLDKNMLIAYDNMTEMVPNMNEPIEYGTICAAPTSYGWHRAMVTNHQPCETVKLQIPDYNEMCGLATVKFLDYGGYLNIPVNQLRQLRSDFMMLPFQGIECYLDGCWTANQNLIEEGKAFLSQQLKDSRTEALVTGYSEDGFPQIRLFITNDAVQNYCINNELSKYGLVMNYKSNQDQLYDTSSCNQTEQHNLFKKDLNALKIVKTESHEPAIK